MTGESDEDDEDDDDDDEAEEEEAGLWLRLVVGKGCCDVVAMSSERPWVERK